jgi:hypothetical protein
VTNPTNETNVTNCTDGTNGANCTNVTTVTNCTNGVNCTNGATVVIDTVEVDKSKDYAAGFTQSFVLIFISELGDKTFLLVMIYTAKIKFWILFLAASFCMCVMHTLSVLVGLAFH